MNGKIKKSPFRTNCITVKDFQKEVFESMFSILVAESCDANRRLMYQDFDTDDDILSCFIGISKQPGNPLSAHILTKKKDGVRILERLRSSHSHLTIREYDWSEEGVWDVVRLLALCMDYFLDEERYPRGLTYFGGYHLCSPVNFGVSVSKEQRVSMSLSVDEHNLLIPRTVTFTTPWDMKKAKGPFFAIDRYQITQLTEQQKDDYLKKGIRIYERCNPFDKNTIPWLRFKTGDASHGKNHEVNWFVRRMNIAYSKFLRLEYKSVEDYDICKVVKKEIVRSTETVVRDLLYGQSIFIDDKSSDVESKTLARRLSEEIGKRYRHLLTVRKDESALLKIQIVKDLSKKDEEGFVDNYEDAESGYVMQHISQEKAGCKESEFKSIVDKIILELAIKKAFVCKEESKIGNLPNGWNFLILNSERIHVKKDCYVYLNTVSGMSVKNSGRAEYHKPIELINDWGRYSRFVSRAKEYGRSDTVFVMQYGKNIYLIVDTMEVPILDQEKICEDENRVEKDTAVDTFLGKLSEQGISDVGLDIVESTLKSMMKTNKKGEAVPRFKGSVGPKILAMLVKDLPDFSEKEKVIAAIKDYSTSMHFLARRRHAEFLEEFFGGYTNIHIWWEKYGKSFCYIASIDPDSLDMKESGKIVTMPHVRKVVLFSGEGKDMIRDKDAILEMLKTGLGRYGSAMAYPYPFKLLKEYMDIETRKNRKKGIYPNAVPAETKTE